MIGESIVQQYSFLLFSINDFKQLSVKECGREILKAGSNETSVRLTFRGRSCIVFSEG